jgi:hypothetical protein
MHDLACLCRLHHPKGKFSWDSIIRARSSYRWRKRIRWVWSIIARSWSGSGG